MDLPEILLIAAAALIVVVGVSLLAGRIGVAAPLILGKNQLLPRPAVSQEAGRASSRQTR